MNATVIWDLGTILSVTTGTLFAKIENIYKILKYMTGEDIYTHQIPRVCSEMSVVIFEQYPQLRDVDTSNVNQGNWKEFLDEMIGKYGKELPIVPSGIFSHKKIDPQEELEQMMKGREGDILVVDEDFFGKDE